MTTTSPTYDLTTYEIRKGASKGRWGVCHFESGRQCGFITYTTQDEAKASIPSHLEAIAATTAAAEARETELVASLAAQDAQVYLATAAQRAYIQRLVDADPAGALNPRTIRGVVQLSDTLTKRAASQIIDTLLHQN